MVIINFIKWVFEGLWILIQIPGPEPYIILAVMISIIVGVVLLAIRLLNRPHKL